MSDPIEQVYVVMHVSSSGWGDAKLVGLYRTEELARQTIEAWSGKPGFDVDPVLREPGTHGEPGFYLGLYTLDKSHWPDGFEWVEPEDCL